MRIARCLLVTAVCSCAAPPASPSPPARPPVAPLVHDEGATAPAADGIPEPAPAVSSDPAASQPPAQIAPEAEEPTPAKFGQSLEPGLYVFPNGLRLHVEQIAGCDFDTSVPCFGGTYRAHATLGKEEATVQWSTRSASVLRHRIELVKARLFTVRK